MKDHASYDANERSQGWPGGSIAVYGNETLRTVTGVSGIEHLNKDSGGNSSQYSGSGKKHGDGDFAGILAHEQKKNEEPRNITVSNVTYGRTGMPSAIYIMMRDYTFQ